jgi:hypothetical protein
MSLKAKDWEEVVNLTDFTGGVNLNDPAISLIGNQTSDCLNAIFLKSGFKRWPGAVNLTAKDAIDDLMRGQFVHGEVSGTQHLYEVHGGVLNEVSKVNGTLTPLYDLTGDNEAYGASSHGTFYCLNGVGMCKVESSTAYRVGIVAPTGVTAAAQTSGGSLADGTYQIYVSYARRVSGSDVLYSKGQLVTSVTITGGGGSGSIDIANFANSADIQVGNKIVWMTYADDSTFYKWYETTNNTTTSFTITSATPTDSAIVYSKYAAFNDVPIAMTAIFAFDKRLFGFVNNKLYYSQKGYTKYDLEVWPANNFNEYPYKITGLFACAGHLCLNTEQNGVMIVPYADVNAKYEHIETKVSFRYMKTVDDWNGDKIGMTSDRVGVFDRETLKFRDWDYGYNIRPVLDRVWNNSNADHLPCGAVHRRNNRLEYLLSVMDTNVNSTNNNRTYALNLSRTVYYDVDNNKTPWEIVGRGANHISVDTSNTLFFGQSYTDSSTIYKENLTASTEIGLYKDNGLYLDVLTNMQVYAISKTLSENMFTNISIENIRALMQIAEPSTLLVTILDDPGKYIQQQTSTQSSTSSLWDVMTWDDDSWSAESLQQYEFKGDKGVNGYTWNLKLSQTANDINFYIGQIMVKIRLQTGHEI